LLFNQVWVSNLHSLFIALAYLDKKSSALKSLSDVRSFLGDCKSVNSGRQDEHRFGEVSKGRLVFVGEGPGREEDLEGRPFVGEAGRLLTKIIENGMGLKREESISATSSSAVPPKTVIQER